MDDFPFDLPDESILNIIGYIPKAVKIYRAVWIELEASGFTEKQILSITSIVIKSLINTKN
jgi:hypothetical protein